VTGEGLGAGIESEELLESVEVAAVIRLARTISLDKAERVAKVSGDHRSRTEAVGPIMRPGTYLEDSERARNIDRATRAFYEFRKVLGEIEQEAEG
jgi:hypothetical protein